MKKRSTRLKPLLEEQEQKLLVQWLELKKIKYSAIAHSTFTKSIKQKVKNKAMGLKKGVPDMMILLKDKLLFIEMKRIKTGKVSPEQIEWLEMLNKIDGVHTFVAYGAEEAIKFVNSHL
jgi:hypothetical protein